MACFGVDAAGDRDTRATPRLRCNGVQNVSSAEQLRPGLRQREFSLLQHDGIRPLYVNRYLNAGMACS